MPVTIPMPPPEGFVPKVGDVIYVDSHYFMSHGLDDVEGGLATVTEVKSGKSLGVDTPFVSVKEHGPTSYNWEMLRQEQMELQTEFGENWAHADPDDRPEFNRWD